MAVLERDTVRHKRFKELAICQGLEPESGMFSYNGVDFYIDVKVEELRCHDYNFVISDFGVFNPASTRER